MTINERLKDIRTAEHLSQKEFGLKIGLGQAGVSWLEKNGNTVTDAKIRQICDLFSINERWLRTGEGKMYIPTDDSLLDDVAKQYKLSKEQKDMVRIIMGFPDEVRQDLAVALLAVCRELANKKEQAPSDKDEARRKAIERELDMERTAKKETS